MKRKIFILIKDLSGRYVCIDETGVDEFSQQEKKYHVKYPKADFVLAYTPKEAEEIMNQ